MGIVEDILDLSVELILWFFSGVHGNCVERIPSQLLAFRFRSFLIVTIIFSRCVINLFADYFSLQVRLLLIHYPSILSDERVLSRIVEFYTTLQLIMQLCCDYVIYNHSPPVFLSLTFDYFRGRELSHPIAQFIDFRWFQQTFATSNVGMVHTVTTPGVILESIIVYKILQMSSTFSYCSSSISSTVGR